MAKCVNTNHPDFNRLVESSGLHPAILSAKMGVWMEENNTDEWPTLEQLNEIVILSKSQVNPFERISQEIVTKKTWKEVAELLAGYDKVLGKTPMMGGLEILRKDDPDMQIANVAYMRGFAKAINNIIPNLLEVKPFNEYWPGTTFVKYKRYKLYIHQSALDKYHNFIGNQNLPEGIVPDTPIEEMKQLEMEFGINTQRRFPVSYPERLDPMEEGSMSNTMLTHMDKEAIEVDNFLLKNKDTNNIIDILNNIKEEYSMSPAHESLLDLMSKNKTFDSIEVKVIKRFDISHLFPTKWNDVKDSDAFYSC